MSKLERWVRTSTVPRTFPTFTNDAYGFHPRSRRRQQSSLRSVTRKRKKKRNKKKQETKIGKSKWQLYNSDARYRRFQRVERRVPFSFYLCPSSRRVSVYPFHLCSFVRDTSSRLAKQSREFLSLRIVDSKRARIK